MGALLPRPFGERVGVRGLRLVHCPAFVACKHRRPGFRPGGRGTFLCFAKEKYPKERRPRCPCPFAALRAACDARACSGAAELASRKRSAQTAAASQMTMLGHVPLPKPTAVTALLGTGRGDPEETCASIALKTKRCACAGTFPVPVPVPVPVSAPTPFGCACGARLAGWRLHRRMQTLREHARRICPSGARKRKASYAAHPASLATQVAPKRSAGVAGVGSPFLCLLSFGEAKESESPAGARPGPHSVIRR